MNAVEECNCRLQEDNMNGEFWKGLDRLVAECEIVIDRPKGSAHPHYPHVIYRMDYGYLRGTTAMDGGGIDLWRGSRQDGHVDAVICTVDLLKKDSEIKLLIGCSEEEIFDSENLIDEGFSAKDISEDNSDCFYSGTLTFSKGTRSFSVKVCDYASAGSEKLSDDKYFSIYF